MKETRFHRMQAAFSMRENGMKYVDIGKYLGVSGARASELYREGKRFRESAIEQGRDPSEMPEPPWYEGCPSVMKTCGLLRAYKTKESLIHAIQNDLHKPFFRRPSQITQIKRFLGMEHDPTEENRICRIASDIKRLEAMGYQVNPPGTW